MSKTYKVLKTVNKGIRKVAPKPASAISSQGGIFRFIGQAINWLFVKPIRTLTFALVGLFYKRGKNSPYVGMFGYTIVFVLVSFLVASGITLAIKFM